MSSSFSETFNKLTILFNQFISQTIDVIHHDVIKASEPYIFAFKVKVSELQCDIFPNSQIDVPHALSVSLVAHGPVLGLDNPSFLFGREATALDL